MILFTFLAFLSTLGRLKNEEQVDEIMAEAATSRPKRKTVNYSTVIVDDTDAEDGNGFIFPFYDYQ